MDWMDGFNKVIFYIEQHLDQDVSYERAAEIFGYSAYHFQRLFLMVTGISLAEYIRCRRLSRAAEELLDGCKVVDVALKYGYSSPNSFQRAFKAMHGVSPGDVKKPGTPLRAFSPLSFELSIKGAQPMEYRMVPQKGFRIVGRKLHTTMERGECYERIPAFWGEMNKSGGPGELLRRMDRDPNGLLGVSNYNPSLDESVFDYFIAVSSSLATPPGMAELNIPPATWAVFPCPNGSPAEIQKFQQRIVMEWLPSSGYEFAQAPDIERYLEDQSMEAWIPVRRKNRA